MSCGKKHKYGNGGQVKVHFADGGVVKKPKLKPHVPPKVEDPIKTAPPGGDQTPGAKGTYPMPKKRKAKK